ncbi:EAL domain-containing protein [Secundilactobacillus muriivasis]
MYRYFIQPQLNQDTRSLIGYEMLIRKYEDDRWILPQHFATIPVAIQTRLLAQVAQQLALKIGSVSFNLNRTQFVNAEMAAALIQVQHAIYPVTLVVEVTEEPSDQDISLSQLQDQIVAFAEHGIQFSLDDVSTGDNRYAQIKSLLPLASELKFAMQNFRTEQRAKEIQPALQFWRQVAEQYNLRLIVEGIENADDEQLLDQLELPFRQGYYYGRPHLFDY